MKKTIKIWTAALLAAVLMFVTVPRAFAAEFFGDVAPDFWAYDSIVEAYNDGVMTGTGVDANGNRVFSPDGALNMNQFFTVLTRAFYNDDVVNSTWEGAWPNQNLDAAEKHNLFNGIASWRGDMEVTREIMAQMMYNVMIDKGSVLPNSQELASVMSRIPDFSSVDSSYQTAVATCYYLDLLSGVNAEGSFAPKGLVNRAQTTVIYVRLKKAISALGTGTTANPGTTTNPGTTNPAQPSSEATLTNGMPVTEENVLALIEEYRNGTREPGEKAKEAGFTSYTNGSMYDPYNPKYRIVLPDGPINGIECSKLAFAFSDDIFGDAPYREVTDFGQVRPGDLIREPGHWSIAVKSAYPSPYPDFYTDPCTQTIGGGAAGSIGWGSNDIRLNTTNGTVIYTRYQN